MYNNDDVKIKFDCFNEQYIDDIYNIEKESIDVAWTKNQLKELISNFDAIARVGIVDGEVVCSYSLNIVFDEGNINNLSVKKEWRGRGIGSMLMEDMIKCARERNLGSLTLEVNENNMVAIALYEKFGFVVEGKRPKFYHGKDGALVMWLRDLK